jgi:dihydroorotase
MKTELIITKPDDLHTHLRDDIYLKTTVPATAAYCQRAIAMPNLKTPITTTALALAYQKRIAEAIPTDNTFTPLMTLYFTDKLTPDEIFRAKQSGMIYAIKLYPAGATTNSAFGIKDIVSIYPQLEAMQQVDMPLLIHGEVVDENVDVFDREKVFIEKYLSILVRDFPKLRIVLEHITTAAAVEFIQQTRDNVAATITAHHLLYDRNALFKKGINPHYYCLPILKRHRDQVALLEGIKSGNPRFFLGTDSAPHSQSNKECAHGCAGIYTAHAALGLYAEAFELCDALDGLENFASRFGAEFYHLPRNKEQIVLRRNAWQVPDFYTFGDEKVIPLRAGEMVNWGYSQ